MPEPFIGEIRVMSFEFAPRGWAVCNGQLLPINHEPQLFSLLGTHYGGDGVNTFALPDLRGRLPMHRGYYYRQGEYGGADFVTLAPENMPKHTHGLRASTELVSPGLGAQDPTGRLLASAQASLQGGGKAPVRLYGEAQNLQPLNAQAVTVSGQGQPHDNRMPYLVLNYIIALTGTFPGPVFTRR